MHRSREAGRIHIDNHSSRPGDCGRYLAWRIMNRNFLILLLVVLAGCTYPTFTNPIVEPVDAQRFDELFGVYQASDPESGETSWLHIGRCSETLPKGFHKFVWVSPPDPKKGDQGMVVLEYIGFVFKNDTSYIVQMPHTENSGDDQAAVILKEWGKSKIDGYTVVRLRNLGKQLRLDFLDEESVEEVVNKELLSGQIEQEIDKTTDPPTIGRKNIVVTAETDALGEFFNSDDHHSLFEDSGFTFTKQNAR